MRRIVSSLGIVGLTLATAALSDETPRPATAPDQGPVGPGAAAVPAHPRGAVPVVLIAQKSPAKSKGRAGKSDKEPATADGPAKETTKPATAEGLQFSKEIAPLLVGQCLRCHNERAAAKNGKLDLSTFEKLKKGGASGPSFVPNTPEESHLYLRLTGEETPRMPRGANDPLSDATIKKVEDWIKAGGRLDAGLDPQALLTSYAATESQLRDAALAKLSVEERDKLVEAKGIERWKKGNPKETPQVSPGKNFMVFGMLPKERVHTLLRTVDAQYPLILGWVAPEESSAPVQKIGIYVFNERGQFVEFVRSVESREVDRAEQSTADLAGSEPYVALVDPYGGRDEPAAPKRSSRSKRKRREETSDVDRSLGGLTTDALAVGIVKRESDKAPLWLRLGLGSYFGARLEPRSPHTQQLRLAAYEQFQFGWNTKATEVLGGEGKPETIRAVGFSIIEALATEPTTRQSLPDFIKSLLKDGSKLDESLKNIFGTDRENFLQGTGEFVGTNYGRLR